MIFIIVVVDHVIVESDDSFAKANFKNILIRSSEMGLKYALLDYFSAAHKLSMILHPLFKNFSDIPSLEKIACKYCIIF